MHADDILKRFDSLSGKRVDWESLWDEAETYCLARARKTKAVFDSTAPLALERFAAALESVLTPRSQKWHSLKTGLKELDEDGQVAGFLEEVTEILFRARYRPEANFANQINQAYLSLGVYGTAVLFIDDELGGGLRYQCLPLRNFWFSENRSGQIDTVFRKYKLTARQALQEFGEEHLPDKIVHDAQDGQNLEKEHEFLHAVFPRSDFKPERKDAGNMPIASYHLALADRAVARESGYRVMPYAVSRYRTYPGEVYGESPAMTVLADIKQVNEMEKTILRAGQKAVDPPLLLADGDLLSGFSLKSGALNYGGLDESGRQMAVPLQTGGRLDIGLEMGEQKRKIINDAFLVNLFMVLVEGGQMTATEVMHRSQEKGQLLAPAMGRQQAELLGPLIARELDILTAAGALPEAPEALASHGEVAISYDSPLSRAQRGEEGAAILNTFQAVAPMAQLDASVMKVFNLPEAVRILAEANGVPQKALFSQEELAGLKAQEENAAQGREAAQMMLEGLPAAAQATKNMAEAESLMAGLEGGLDA